MSERLLQGSKIGIEECDEDICVSEDVKVVPSFKKMGLKMELLRGIYEYGFEKPSLVQQRAICQILLGRDVVVQAQSGTGKTATFCIGSLQRMDESRKETQALFLAPTRELASQIHQVASALADYLSVKCVLCCGGRSNAGEMGKTVEKGSQIVVGTPGRILEMLRQGCLKLAGLRIFVIDEADEMLNQGLRDQLEQICKRLPTASRSSTGDDIFASLEQFQGRTAVQRVVVSATWTSGCREVMQQFLDNPVLILVPRDELTLSSIIQSYIDVGGEEWKFEALADIFASICVPQTVVFVNTRRKVEWLAERLTHEGFAVSAAHGEMDQTSRDSVMGQFRAGRSRILVTTDVWARGIDVQTVGLVVNYDLPSTAAVYLHRIGRSGRFGRRGIAISLVGGQSTDKAHLATIAKAYGTAIEPAPAQLSELTERAVDTEARPPLAGKRPRTKELDAKRTMQTPTAVWSEPQAKMLKAGAPTNANPDSYSTLPTGKASKKQKLKARRRKNKEKRMKKKKVKKTV